MDDKQYLEAVQRSIKLFEGYDWFDIAAVLHDVRDETERRLEALKAQEDNIKSDMWEQMK